MSTDGVIQRSFGGGELAPALHARADQVKYITGLRQCKNWIIRKAGGVSMRPGTLYMATCKTNSPTVQLLPYISERAGESVLIECGAGYLRFFQDGEAVGVSGVPAYAGGTPYVIGDIVLSGGVNYYCIKATTGNAPPNATYWYAMPAGNLLELPTGFAGDLPYWSQSGRVITFTHEDHAPQELTYEALTRWTIKTLATAPRVAVPQNPVLVVGTAGARRYAYVVTAAGADYEESEPSGQVINVAVAEPTPDAPNLLSWDAVAGATEYYVYADIYNNGVFGYLGTAVGQIQFRDPGFVPDFTITPPIAQVKFATANNYPSVSASYQQRRFMANTRLTPEGIFASRVGYPSNYGISSPLQDDDALTFRTAGNQHNPVRHLVPLKQLVVLTDACGWIVQGGADGVLAPNSINADQMLYAGSAPVRPVVVGNSLLYVQARGTILRDLQFDQQVEGLAGRDLTVFSSHLFGRTKTIRKVDYQQNPDSIVWCVRDDGVLLGCTYLREQEVWGWHKHMTGTLKSTGDPFDGFFWDVCCIPEEDEDAVYFIVRRTVNGATVRYIERLATSEIVDFDADAHYVDCGLDYRGAPLQNVAGLLHLRGKVVAVVGNGDVIFNGDPAAANAATFTVSATGTLPALPAAYARIHVGLQIREAQIETLDLDAQGTSIRSKKKNVTGLDVLLESSSRKFYAGPDATHLKQVAIAGFDPAGDTFDGLVELAITSHFTKAGRVLIRQTEPLPITVLGVIPQVEMGG